MKIEATAKDIRALLQLIEVEQSADANEAGRQTREALTRRVPRHLLERYRSLDGRRAPVLAAIEKGACSGCHMRLPTMVEYSAHRSPAIHTCPCCRRMLYVPELVSESAPGKKQPPRDLESSTPRPARRAEP